MPIDVTTLPPDGRAPSEVGAGWWMARLASQLRDQKRRDRLDLLNSWHEGTPPLPGVSANAREAIRQFHEHARSNFAALIVEAVRERQRVRGIRTSADGDSTGDAEAWQLWLRMRMPRVSADVHRLKGRFGESYAMISQPPAEDPGTPIVTAEDPRFTAVECDPLRPWVPVAGLKQLHDPVAQQDRLYLLRRGRVDVAFREAKTRRSAAGLSFDPRSWEWDEALTKPLPHPQLMPIVPFQNLDGRGEFEPHLDLLRRINFMVLQRLTIAVLQAFKQRAVKGVPLKDDKGNEIDYNDIFSASPGALWLLPAAAEMWESGQVDLSGILNGTEADVKHLAAVSRTPLPMLDPTSANQTAEGAAMAKEGLVFKIEDRNDRDGDGWSQVMSSAFLWVGDEERAQLASIAPIWAPPQRSSLTERMSSVAQANAGGVPFRTRMIDAGEFSPDQVDRMEDERDDDLLFSQRLAAVKSPAPVAQPAAAVFQEPGQRTPQPVAAGAGA